MYKSKRNIIYIYIVSNFTTTTTKNKEPQSFSTDFSLKKPPNQGSEKLGRGSKILNRGIVIR